MDDFDNDGLLDIVVTSLDPTEPMAFYRNKGDGTFEDRTRGGRPDRTARRPVLRPDRLQQRRPHGHLHLPRRLAAAALAMRPSLLRNNGDGTFTDVTREAGLLDPVNSNSRVLGRLRQRRLARPVRLLRAPAQPAVPQQGRRHLRGGRRAGRRRRQTVTASARGPPGSTSTTTAIPTCSSTAPRAEAARLYRNNRDGTFTGRHRRRWASTGPR